MLNLEGEGKREGKREGGKKCSKMYVHKRKRTVSCGKCGCREKGEGEGNKTGVFWG